MTLADDHRIAERPAMKVAKTSLASNKLQCTIRALTVNSDPSRLIKKMTKHGPLFSVSLRLVPPVCLLRQTLRVSVSGGRLDSARTSLSFENWLLTKPTRDSSTVSFVRHESSQPSSAGVSTALNVQSVPFIHSTFPPIIAFKKTGIMASSSTAFQFAPRYYSHSQLSLITSTNCCVFGKRHEPKIFPKYIR